MNIDFERVMEAIDGDEQIGFCIACGSESERIEPDARNCKCESCHSYKAFGAEQILIEFA